MRDTVGPGPVCGSRGSWRAVLASLLLATAGVPVDASELGIVASETFTYANVDSNDGLDDPDNVILADTSSIGVQLTAIIISGQLTEVALATYASEARFQLSYPDGGGGTATRLLSGSTVQDYTGTLVVPARRNPFGFDTTGAVSFEFYESADDAPGAVDQVWDTVTFEFVREDVINGDEALGTLLTDGVPLTLADRSQVPLGLDFYTFTITEPVQPGRYLNIQTREATGGVSHNTELFLFDADGNLVAADDDGQQVGQGDLYSLLSFGVDDSLAGGDTAAGADGATLPAGDYTVVAGLFETTVGSTIDSLNPGATAGGDYDLQITFDAADTTAPSVTRLTSLPATVDDELLACESLPGPPNALVATFSEAMFDPAGDVAAGDASNPANYLLVDPGADGTFDTTSCAPSGDDGVIGTSVAFSDPEVTLTVEGVDPGLLRVFLCDTLIDLSSNSLDGDGIGGAGGSFVRDFRVELDNAFLNPQLDCDEGGWELTGVGALAHDPAVDVAASGSSGALQLDTTGAGLSTIAQCSVLDGGPSRVQAAAVQSSGASPAESRAFCEVFASDDCSGGTLDRQEGALAALSASFAVFELELDAVSGAGSYRCGVDVQHADSGIVHVDGLRLRSQLFADDFESGDALSWSSQQP